MGCALHSNVGLMHGTMGIYNAWCDRVPMIIIGATGPVDSAKRRPWIDWIHTSRTRAHWSATIVKWDDQPASPEAHRRMFAARQQITRTAPTGPVYICLDADLQEEPLKKDVEFPTSIASAAAAAGTSDEGRYDAGKDSWRRARSSSCSSAVAPAPRKPGTRASSLPNVSALA